MEIINYVDRPPPPPRHGRWNNPPSRADGPARTSPRTCVLQPQTKCAPSATTDVAYRRSARRRSRLRRPAARGRARRRVPKKYEPTAAESHVPRGNVMETCIQWFSRARKRSDPQWYIYYYYYNILLY